MAPNGWSPADFMNPATMPTRWLPGPVETQWLCWLLGYLALTRFINKLLISLTSFIINLLLIGTPWAKLGGFRVDQMSYS